MKILSYKTNNTSRKEIFKNRFYIFIFIFFLTFFTFGYKLFFYKDAFVVTLLSYLLLMFLCIFLCIPIHLLIQGVAYKKFKNINLILWIDNLHISIYYNKYASNKRHVLSLILPFITLTGIPLFITTFLHDSLVLISIASANMLFSSLDLYNLYRFIRHYNDKFIFNGIDIITEAKHKDLSEHFKENTKSEYKNIELDLDLNKMA
ncbi:metalloprotease family protein [Clostridium sardiniense]|uniref:metalloprotease family protein n=1 Tax=Clostridium sardiniense TaxID=29369 RepID=UPI003D32D77E